MLLVDRVRSANSITELGLMLSADPRLRQPLPELVPQLALAPEHLGLLKHAVSFHEALRIADFLARKDLHKHCGVPYDVLLAALKRWAVGALPATVPDALAAARSFGELAPLVPQALSRARLFDVVFKLRCATALQKRMLTQVPGDLPLAEALSWADRVRWAPSTANQLFAAFKDLLGKGQAQVTSAHAPTVASLHERVAAIDLPDLATWPWPVISPGSPALTLSQAISNLSPMLVSQALDQFEERLAQLRLRQAPSAPQPQHPGLQRLQRAALEVRGALAPTYPWGLANLEVRLRSDTELLLAEVRSPRDYRAEVVSFIGPLAQWAERRELACTCSAATRPTCIHRVVVLEGLALGWTLEREASALLAEALVPGWERLLKALGDEQAVVTPKPGILSFRLGGPDVEVLFHELGKKGPSTRGKRLEVGQVLGRVEGHDARIAERLALVTSRFGAPKRAFVGDALRLMVGHPRVFIGDERLPSPVVTAPARLAVEEQEGGFRLGLSIDGVDCTPESLQLFESSTGHLAVTHRPGGPIVLADFDASLQRALSVMTRFGRELPKEAAPRLVELVPRLERAAVVELPEDLRGDELPPRSAPVAQVSGTPEALSLALRVEPLEHGPLFVPGAGVPVSAAFEGGRRTFTRRDLEQELRQAHALAEELGLDPATADQPWTWALDASDRHVETLRRLSRAQVPVEWKAPKVRFTDPAKLERLRLTIARKKDWFGLDGEVTVDERRVSLAALLEAARARRRFVRLAPGDFAQLSEELVAALQPLAHLGAPGKAPELTLGAAPLLEALAPQIEHLEAATEWAALMERLATARQARFAVPRGLTATLRDYQVEGFEWLSRLAQWGAGACLADDMGLGKTLQALALLVSRAPRGPALVVAPSSVLHTWRVEAAKFAPKLKVELFHEGDRDLGKLGPGDVRVVSWSLLARQAEAFSKVRLATLVFDEAHAIKNAGTQRAKAAHGLDAEFTVALTGTPVENHVGELWSLFKAVMPSLLGSEESFRLRFGAGDRDALGALATLVRPFILRRTKDAVAKELPPRTDLEVVVPLSDEERALYDDVRLSTLGELGELTGETKRFEVLAALTRLRLTACHPKLVDETWKGPTSKLTRLLELLKDLVRARHRVLVFSQFTLHLALVVQALRAEGLLFSYLDGQVPVTERQRRVEAFQRGEGGDVFLISLKAGGTGLTLTEANYVIHLDPWWNPAVEDQASDRAHRLGQSKPVTVYRLIAEGTIEQQILSLHRDKRELVDALLSGSDASGKLSTAQLAELIRGA